MYTGLPSLPPPRETHTRRHSLRRNYGGANDAALLLDSTFPTALALALALVLRVGQVAQVGSDRLAELHFPQILSSEASNTGLPDFFSGTVAEPDQPERKRTE